MFRRNLSILLLLIVPFSAQANEKWPAPPIKKSPPSIIIPVLYSDSVSCTIPFNHVGNLIVIQAKADTLEGNFILDTGAPGLLLNITYFRDYPIEVRHNEEETSVAGRGDPTQQTSVRDLSFGAMRFHNTIADMTNLGNIENAKGIKVLGLLGLNLFSQCELIIDFEKGLLLLHRIGKKEEATYQHECLTDVSSYHTLPIEIANSRMTTTTEVAGKKLKLVIDCAAESTLLDSRLPDKVTSTVTITGRVKLTAPGNRKADALYGKLALLQLGEQKIENLPVVILNLEYTCFADDICVNGVLGIDFLSQHRIGFNFVKRKMYLWK